MTPELITATVSAVCVGVGVVFLVAGTVGMLRFPDVYTRLHALTKADNLGFGFVTLGLVAVAPDWTVALKAVITWLFILVAGTTAAHLVGRAAYREGLEADETAPGREVGS